MSLRSLLILHGYAFLFCYVFTVEAGVPIPADPLLLVMGALAGAGRYSIPLSIGLGALAAVAADVLWYELARARGSTILSVLCKISLEPDSCVRRAENGFARRGPWSLLFSKFVPGLNLVSVPVAGAIRMRRTKFLAADCAGCLLWCATYVLIGRIFYRQVDTIVVLLGLYGHRAALVIAILIAGYICFRYLQRRMFIRSMRVNRISPADAFALLQDGNARVVDLRHAGEVGRTGLKIPGALVLAPEDLRSSAHEIPPANEIILYCT